LLFNQATNWLNDCVPPHKLVSISIFEDSHSETGPGKYILTIAHTCGLTPKPLGDGSQKIYHYGCWNKNSLDDALGRAVNEAMNRGSDTGLMLTNAIHSKDNLFVVGVIFWDQIHQAKLADQERPTECVCNIF